MGSREKKEGGSGLSRRDFLKVSAAGATVAATMGWSLEPAAAVQNMTEGTDYKTFHTTCPYCSASCGQVVAVSMGTQGYAEGAVLDIWGDADSPISQGGLCAKGAGSYQLVTNLRRLGYPDDPSAPAAYRQPNSTLRYDATYTDGIAWKRQGNDPWTKTTLDAAMTEIAGKLVTARGDITPGLTAASNAKSVQFFGSSHMNNEQNYLYRKLIANFGTSLVEHQARI